MIINLKNTSKPNRNKLIIKILFLIIISQSLLLVPSYYAAWERGEHYFVWKETFMNCFSLNPNENCDQDYGKPLSLDTGFDHKMFNYFFENQYSFFNDASFQRNNIETTENRIEHLSKYSKSDIGIGKIEKINDSIISDTKFLIDYSSPVKIEGWFVDKNFNELDHVYLLINDEPLFEFKHSNFDVYKYETIDGIDEWSISFFSGYLQNDCSKIKIVGIQNDEKINFNDKIELCKPRILE